MKRFLIIICMLCSAHVFASDEVVALTKFHETENGKMFGAQWFDDSEFGFINMGLVWAQYGADVQEGFKLGEAKAALFVSPILPEGCTIKSLKGNLNWIENGVSSVSATLTGRSCKVLFDSIAQTPIEIVFLDVPHMVRTKATKILILKINDTP